MAVIGAGQSAIESAALLREGGAEVEVLIREPKLRWLRPKWPALRPLIAMRRGEVYLLAIRYSAQAMKSCQVLGFVDLRPA